MWVEFVVGSRPCSEGLSPGSLVVLPTTKTNTSKLQFDREFEGHRIVSRKGGGKRGHIVAHDCFYAAQTGKHLLRTQKLLKEIRNISVSRTQILCPQQMLRARANGETFVSATMCPMCSFATALRLLRLTLVKLSPLLLPQPHFPTPSN